MTAKNKEKIRLTNEAREKKIAEAQKRDHKLKVARDKLTTEQKNVKRIDVANVFCKHHGMSEANAKRLVWEIEKGNIPYLKLDI